MCVFPVTFGPHAFICGSRTYRVFQNDCRGCNNLPFRSPDNTQCDFFLWGYAKGHVYVPPLPASIPGTEGTNQNRHWNHHRRHATDSVDKKNQLDVTFCILYFSSNSWSTCFGQSCAHHQELTTAWCYSLVLVCAVAAGRWSSPVGR